VGFGLWIDAEEHVAWAQGTHEYRPMGAAAIAVTDQFRPRDFSPARRCPPGLSTSFAGFFGSLEELNEYLRDPRRRQSPRATPPHVR
jgi:hypothetical protein